MSEENLQKTMGEAANQEPSIVLPQGYDMACLEVAAKAGNEAAFLRALKDVVWQDRSLTDFVRAIRLALEAGAHLAAHQISIEGMKHHPDSAEIQRYAHLLAPPKVTSVDAPPNPNQGANLNWLKVNADEYRGKWVAIKDGKLLASADAYQELVGKVGETKGTGILLTKAF